MGLERTPDGFEWPHPTGDIMARFNGTQHPSVAELNAVLDEEGRYHHGGSSSICGPMEYSDYFGGDPGILSWHIGKIAGDLMVGGEHDIAFHLLDEGLRWPNSQVRGDLYVSLAVLGGGAGKVDMAIGIALDPTRVLAGRRPATLAGVPDKNRDAHRVALASEWLARSCRIYRATAVGPGKVHGWLDEPLHDFFMSRVDEYTRVMVNSLACVSLADADELFLTNIPADELLKEASEALEGAGQQARAERLIALYSKTHDQSSQGATSSVATPEEVNAA